MLATHNKNARTGIRAFLRVKFRWIHYNTFRVFVQKLNLNSPTKQFLESSYVVVAFIYKGYS